MQLYACVPLLLYMHIHVVAQPADGQHGAPIKGHKTAQMQREATSPPIVTQPTVEDAPELWERTILHHLFSPKLQSHVD